MSDGHRCALRDVAVLRVIANEAYGEFAAQLQKEIEDETSSVFESRSVRDARARRTVELREDQLDTPQFRKLWEHVSPRTTFHIRYEDRRFAKEAAQRLRTQPTLEHGKIRALGARLDLDLEQGVVAEAVGERAPVEVDGRYPVGDLISQVAEQNQIGRGAAAQILQLSGRIDEAPVNPQQFLSQAREAIRGALGEMLGEGVIYRRRPGGDAYEASLFAQHPLTAYDDNAESVDKSVYAEVVVDSDLERRIAKKLNGREDILLFLKLPPWFKVDTPIGSYNPDWAYLRVDGDDERLCFVRESKPTRELENLRPGEQRKIEFAKLHFAEIGTDFDVIDDPAQI